MTDTMTETAWAQGSRLAASGASFVDLRSLETLESLSAEDRDDVEFSIIEVDDSGTILTTNRYEAELSAVASDRAVGRNYFTDIAPCTNNRLFFGTFRKGVLAGSMNLLFFYTFTYKMSPTEVKVHLYRSSSGRNWVLVKRK